VVKPAAADDQSDRFHPSTTTAPDAPARALIERIGR
jgi:hypothetical protein